VLVRCGDTVIVISAWMWPAASVTLAQMIMRVLQKVVVFCSASPRPWSE